jgi:hypothetical protein
MRVCAQGGYTYENITRLWIEENCRLRGRKKIFHRIWGYDADKGCEIVLDWGTDLQQVREYYKKMTQRLQQDSDLIWRCEYCTLTKEEKRRNVSHEQCYVNRPPHKGPDRHVYAGRPA